MAQPVLEQIGKVLALGYPGADKETPQEFRRVLELVLPSLAQRASVP